MNEGDVLKATVFMTLAGSHAYGTNQEDSDLDRRGVCIPRKKSLYFGMNPHAFEQKDKWGSGDDLCVYDFRKAVDLMLGNNPNMLDLLFSPKHMWEIIEPAWIELYEIRSKFLSKRVRHTYGGYAFAQLKRIKHHRVYLLNPPKKKPERSDFGLPEQKPVSNDDLQAFLWLVAKLLQNSVEHMNLSESTKTEIESVNLFGLVQGKLGEHGEKEAQIVKDLTHMPDSFVDICMREKRYMQAVKQFESFQNWKNERNPKRQQLEAKYGYDTKHGMHLVRLMRMAQEILSTHKVNVWRDDRDELISIRNGAYSYEKLAEFAFCSDKKLIDCAAVSTLPDLPAVDEIENLCTDIVEKHLYAGGLLTPFFD